MIFEQRLPHGRVLIFEAHSRLPLRTRLLQGACRVCSSPAAAMLQVSCRTAHIAGKAEAESLKDLRQSAAHPATCASNQAISPCLDLNCMRVLNSTS